MIGIIAMSAYKLTTKNIGKDRLLWAIFVVSAAVTVVTESEIVWLFLGAGVLVWLVAPPPKAARRGKLHGIARRRAAARLPSSRSAASTGTSSAQIGAYFAYAGTFVFGSGLAIVPFLYGGVVKEYGWLTDRQFVDAVAVAMITPGAGGHHDRLHRLPRGRLLGRGGRGARHLPAVLPLHDPAGAVLQEARQAAGASSPSSTA